MPKLQREGLTKESLNLFDQADKSNRQFDKKKYAGTVINGKSSGISSAMSIHSELRSGFDCTGVRSPTMS